MKISFAICTHNEGVYINNLLSSLIRYILFDKSGVKWEIVVVDDFSTDKHTLEILNRCVPQIKLIQHALSGDYASHKNFMNEQCTGDWIFNLDADEIINLDTFGFLPQLLDNNTEIEAYAWPRINTVEGLTFDHVQKWGWVLTKMESHRKIRVMNAYNDEYKLLKDFQYIIDDTNGVVTYYEPIIMYPDNQTRFYKNDRRIHWVNKVHERLVGYTQFGVIPSTETELAIVHAKMIDRQEKQNAFYETFQK